MTEERLNSLLNTNRPDVEELANEVGRLRALLKEVRIGLTYFDPLPMQLIKKIDAALGAK